MHISVCVCRRTLLMRSIMGATATATISGSLASTSTTSSPEPSSAVLGPLSSSSPSQGRHGGSVPRLPRGKHTQQSNPVAASVQSALDYVGQCIDVHCLSPGCDVLPIFTAGTFAFYATAFSSQYVQQRFLRISTGTRPALLPITVGAATVALGSWMGHLAGLGTSAAWDTVQSSWKDNTLMENIPKIGGLVERSVREMTRPMFSFAEDANRLGRGERKEAWMHAARM